MGVVCLPEAPSAPSFEISLELDRYELQEMVGLLKGALRQLQTSTEPSPAAPAPETSRIEACDITDSTQPSPQQNHKQQAISQPNDQQSQQHQQQNIRADGATERAHVQVPSILSVVFPKSNFSPTAVGDYSWSPNTVPPDSALSNSPPNSMQGGVQTYDVDGEQVFAQRFPQPDEQQELPPGSQPLKIPIPDAHHQSASTAPPTIAHPHSPYELLTPSSPYAQVPTRHHHPGSTPQPHPHPPHDPYAIHAPYAQQTPATATYVASHNPEPVVSLPLPAISHPSPAFSAGERFVANRPPSAGERFVANIWRLAREQSLSNPSSSPAPPPAAPTLGSTRPRGAVDPHGAASSMRWKRCYSTGREEHNNDAVRCASYSATFAGLPGGDGHAGWLVTSSQGLLNLWECSGGGGQGGEPSLMLMHSQVSDHDPAAMALDLSAGVLICAAASTHGQKPFVALHSLNPETGFLAPRGNVSLHSPPGLHQPPCVVSLSPLGGPLMTSFAASTGSEIQVHDLHIPQQRARWKAHESIDITAMACSPHSVAMLSGAANGALCMWDLQKKPNKPVRTWCTLGQVSGIKVVSDTSLVSASLGGEVALWDVRADGGALDQCSPPDGGAIKGMAVSPFNDMVAVSTDQGLYCIPLKNQRFGVPVLIDQKVTQSGKKMTKNGGGAVQWNVSTGELIATYADGGVSVYRDFQS